MSELTIRGVSRDNIGTATKLARIFEAVIREREFQTDKYGPVLEARFGSLNDPTIKYVQGPGGHELGSWLIILEKELDEAKDAAIHGGMKGKTGRNTVRHEILQIMAVCCAALEQHGLEEGQ